MHERDTMKIMDFALSKIEKEDKMCVPSVFIRDDGKGFVVRKGGMDFAVWESYVNRPPTWAAVIIGHQGGELGEGGTITKKGTLKPCPIPGCLGEAVVIWDNLRNDGLYFTVMCGKCGVRLSISIFIY